MARVCRNPHFRWKLGGGGYLGFEGKMGTASERRGIEEKLPEVMEGVEDRRGPTGRGASDDATDRDADVRPDGSEGPVISRLG